MTDHDDFDDELLSAYVDGELTAAERAVVEDRLRTDPQAAQLVEELRALSSAIQALPREPLGRDLRPAVQAALDEADADDKARHVIPLSEPLDPPRGFRRGFFWSTIAIAAALLLMFTEAADEEAERDLAVAKAKPVPERVIKSHRDAADLENAPRPMGEMRAAPEETDASKDSAVRALQRDDDSLAAASPASAPAAPADAPPAAFGGGLTDEAKLAGTPTAAPDAASGMRRWDGAVDQPLSSVEIAVAAPDVVDQFDRVLRANGVVTQPESGERLYFKRELAPQQSGQADRISQYEFGVESPAEAASEGQHRGAKELGEQAALEKAKSESTTTADAESGLLAELPASEDAPLEVLVEATPAQIDQIVAACQSQPDTFPQVLALQLLPFGGGEGRIAGARASADRGGVGGAVVNGRAGGAADAFDVRQGRAWYFRSGENLGGELADNDPAADKQIARSRSLSVQAGAAAQPPAGAAASSIATADKNVRAESAESAKAAEPSDQSQVRRQPEVAQEELGPIEDGKIRVLFVLRAAPPAVAAPAAADAGPAEDAPAKE